MTERYHFAVNDGSPDPFRSATELANPMEARREALRIAAERLYNRDGSLVIPPGWRIDVTDDAGRLLFQIQFSMTEGEGGTSPNRLTG